MNPSADTESLSGSDTPISNFNPLQVLARRWPFLVVGLLIGAVLGVLIHYSSQPQYQSSAQLLVIKKRTEVTKEGDARVGAVDDYVATQVTLIKSEKIRLAAAAKARELGMMGELPGNDAVLAGMIAAGLTITRDKDSGGVLNLTFRSNNPDDCKRFLEAIIEAHKAELYSIYDRAGQERMKSLEKMEKAIKDQRKNAGEERLTLLKAVRDITIEDVPSIRTRVGTNRDQKRTLESERINLEDQLQLIRDTKDNQQDRLITLAQLTAQLRPATFLPAGSPMGVNLPASTPSILGALERQKRDLADNVGLGKDHPKIAALDAQIAAIREELGRPATDSSDTKPALDELGAYQKWAEQKVKTIDKQLKHLSELLKKDEAILKDTSTHQDTIDAFTAQIQQFDSEIKRLEAELMMLQVTQTSTGAYSAETITPPGTGYKIAPVLMRSVVTGLGIGVLLGALMMVLAEMSDKSFRSPAEIRQRLGLAVIGHIPHIKPATDGSKTVPDVDHVLVAATRPRSTESEAIRGLRTQLYFSTQGRGHQVIQVTSPTPGDGKSTVAANLAISIAQSGKRTVLIDCDFRKPRIHKLFAIAPLDMGLASVVAGMGTINDALFPSGLANLDLLTCGPRPANPAELLTSPQFQDVLTKLREMYDFVIIDTPPLLAVSDPAIVAPRADGVIMVFRMSKRIRPLAERAREVLATVGANALGVVVNAANLKDGGYGYGYSYSYGYGYKYSDYKYADKYHDDHEAA